MNALDIQRKYADKIHLKPFIQLGVEAETKEAYLSWVKDWKQKYEELSNDIRAMKGMRKEYKYTYREKGNDTDQKRTKVGDNDNYDSSASYRVGWVQYQAELMLAGRARAKVASWKRKCEADRLAA